VLRVYPRETGIAEKLEALTALGMLNSRMKDYYDLDLLSRMYSFDGELLAEAVRATSVTEELHLKPNRSGSRTHTAMIPHELSNGALSCGGADSENRRVISRA
jgi:hypothetical protein